MSRARDAGIRWRDSRFGRLSRLSRYRLPDGGWNLPAGGARGGCAGKSSAGTLSFRSRCRRGFSCGRMIWCRRRCRRRLAGWFLSWLGCCRGRLVESGRVAAGRLLGDSVGGLSVGCRSRCRRGASAYGILSRPVVMSSRSAGCVVLFLPGLSSGGVACGRFLCCRSGGLGWTGVVGSGAFLAGWFSAIGCGRVPVPMPLPETGCGRGAMSRFRCRRRCSDGGSLSVAGTDAVAPSWIRCRRVACRFGCCRVAAGFQVVAGCWGVPVWGSPREDCRRACSLVVGVAVAGALGRAVICCGRRGRRAPRRWLVASARRMRCRCRDFGVGWSFPAGGDAGGVLEAGGCCRL